MNELALFAGAGGGILGAKLLGWRTVCAVEIDPWNRDVLLARQRDGVLPDFPIWDDVTTFEGTRWRGFVDIITGGFPCQDISISGSGDGLEGERSGLWKEMARIIGEVRPSFTLVENSPNLTGRGLGVVLGDLAEMGFDARWGVLGARHAGAIHKRDRIWILANSASKRENPGQNARRVNSQVKCDWWSSASSYGATISNRGCKGEIPGHIGLGDGMAGWMERLKSSGNGQVPAVVRLAWETLTESYRGKKNQ